MKKNLLPASRFLLDSCRMRQSAKAAHRLLWLRGPRVLRGPVAAAPASSPAKATKVELTIAAAAS
jgi:hypothetical protein